MFYQLRQDIVSAGADQGQMRSSNPSYPNYMEQWVPHLPLSTDWLSPTPSALGAYATSADHLVQEAASRIQSAGWDVGTFLAELPETVETLRGLATRFGDWFARHQQIMERRQAATLRDERLQALRRHRFLRNPSLQQNAWKKFPRSLAKWSREFVSDWMLARYGLRPLMYDFKDVYEVVTEGGKKVNRVLQVASSTDVQTNISTGVRVGGDSVRDDYMTDSNTVTIGLRGKVAADLSFNNQMWINPVTTALELIPLSWVVDWFLSVGAALDALSFVVLNPKHVAAQGWLIEYDRMVDYWSVAKLDRYYTSGTNRWLHSKSTLTARVPTSVPLSPAPVLKLSEAKVVDLLSLAFQRIRR